VTIEMKASESLSAGRESFYREFDSPLIRRLRRETHGETWAGTPEVSAEKLRGDIHCLKLSPFKRVRSG
jgi:hypothetical protein